MTNFGYLFQRNEADLSEVKKYVIVIGKGFLTETFLSHSYLPLLLSTSSIPI